MKNCTHCAHAKWQKTTAGKLHRSGDGRCTYPWTMPQLPQAYYWISTIAPTPAGGWINRKVDFDNHCTYFLHKG